MLLVTGGEDTSNTRHASTELLGPGSGSWRLLAALLPRPMKDMRLATVDNVLYLTGEMRNIRGQGRFCFLFLSSLGTPPNEVLGQDARGGQKSL